MSKIYDGIELLEMIKDGKIPYRTKINIVSDNETLKFYTIYGEYRQLHLIRDDNGKIEVIRNIDTEDLLTHKFEIEEQEEKDIQGIKELDEYEDITNYIAKSKIKEKINQVEEEYIEFINSKNKSLTEKTLASWEHNTLRTVLEELLEEKTSDKIQRIKRKLKE